MLLRDEFSSRTRRGVLRAPRGTVFHIPPGNVDTMFVYSWALALLAGNRNVVRISSRNSPQSLILCRLLRGVVGDRNLGQFFVQYGHDPAVTKTLSDCCDARVIWGGDRTIRTIRDFPLPVHAKEITFPDRWSLSAISAPVWLSASENQREDVSGQFFNDTFWFDQMACSSPRMLVWCGVESECRNASGDFLERLQQEIDRRGYRIEPSVRMQKLLFAAGAVIDQPVLSYVTAGPQLTVLELGSLDTLGPEHCGGGLLFQFHTASLIDIAPHIQRRHQTLTYFGFEPAELLGFVQQLQGRGIDRVVPIGQALRFSTVWDGYDLLDELTRAVVIL
ncbi:MAG TPA: acyl-CoA reductase [Bryobacteraceae bacterium]|nr:acyl-CoA reductase [Bryobacteraceae bacterium]